MTGCRTFHNLLWKIKTTRCRCIAHLKNPAENQEIDRTADEAIQFLNSLRDYVEKNFDDVGPKLATETLKMHYGIAEPRNIRGVATENEEKMLSEEGIKLLKVPMIKKRSDSKLN